MTNVELQGHGRLEEQTISQFITALKLCTRTRNWEAGKKVHHRAAALNIHRNKHVASALIKMYSKCLSMVLAKRVFDMLSERDTVVWNSLILGYVENGESEQAIKLFITMDCTPNCVTYQAALKAYGYLASKNKTLRMFYLEKGVELHTQLKELGLTSDVQLLTTVLWMYTKCKSMTQAQEVFDKMSHRDVAAWNSLMLGYVENGKSAKALELFPKMDCTPSSVSYVAVLKACGELALERGSNKVSCLRTGIDLHKQIITHGFGSDVVVATTLVDMYSKCGSMSNAREVFDELPHKTVVTWTSLITGYVRNGESSVALDVFAAMDCKLGPATFMAALKACGGLVMEKRFRLEKGMALHEQISCLGFETDVLVANSLIHMYGRCGDMNLARKLFEKMTHRDVVSWNSLLFGYVENGESQTTITLFSNMDCRPNSVTYITVLKAHASRENELSERDSHLREVVHLHRELQEQRLDTTTAPVASALMDAYGSLGCMQRAKEVFDRIEVSHRDVVCWNTLMFGYVENCHPLVAMELLCKMDSKPTPVTYTTVLTACGRLASQEKVLALEYGIGIHERVRDHVLELDVTVANSLIVMYGKCNCMQRALDVFRGLRNPNVGAWTSLILGYVENEDFLVALDLFSRMECEPSPVTYVAVLKACTGLYSSEETICRERGFAVHKQLIYQGLDNELFVSNALISMYMKSSSLDCARNVFHKIKNRDIVSWNSLITGYIENKECLHALELFSYMDCEPCPLTYIAVLKAYGELARDEKLDSLFCLEKVIKIHKQLKERAFDADLGIRNSLVDVYSKCQSMQHARTVFEAMPFPNVVTWSSLILGYVANGEFKVALELFTGMDCTPSSVTLIAALKACGALGALGVGQRIHGVVCRLGVEEDVVANAIMDFYVKCGDLDRASEVLNTMHCPNVVSWNTVIGGYSSVGNVYQTLYLAKEMQANGFQIDNVTLTCILTSCNHTGQVVEDKICLDSFLGGSTGSSSVKHFNSMIDMLGRANRLNEALSLIKSMPFEPNSITWTTLLAACSKWKNLEVGKMAFDALLFTSTSNYDRPS